MGARAQLAGIDGCTGGWVAAHLRAGELTWQFAPTDAIADLIADVTAIDIPVGLVEAGWRPFDLELKEAMGRHASRVFLTPPREVLELASAANSAAQEASRRLTGQGVSRQALALAPRILALDAYLATRPHARVHESFPELEFMRMSGATEPLESKKTARGAGQRLEALAQWRPDIAQALAQAPSRIPLDDCLDALACLWAAERIAAGTCESMGTGPANSQ